MNTACLAHTELFQGIPPEKIESVLREAGALRRSYRKKETVCRAGDTMEALGMVLQGGVNIEHDDLWGGRSILAHISPGEIFAETYACIPGEVLMVSAVASEDSEILFLDIRRVAGNGLYQRLAQNLLTLLAKKTLTLTRRILHTSPKSIRGRLTAYLTFQAKKQGSLTFTIPFDRQQLADYLGVDRSALSSELSAMQREGLLTFRKNRFSILLPEP